MERLSTGISGLDALIEGGIPTGFSVLLAGHPGTGKTILAAHFLYEGLNKGENGLYVSFSESKEQFFVNMEKLGMNFRDFEQHEKLAFLDFASTTREGMRDSFDEILTTIRGTNVKRMVIDSITAIGHSYRNEVISARIILQTILGKVMRLEGVTSILIAEIPTGLVAFGLGIEESIADSNIMLDHGPNDASPLVLRVMKMRGTSISKEPHVCSIKDGKGMVLYPKQSLKLTYPATNERVPSGITGLDQRTGGGLLKGTVTGVVGAVGSGKSTCGFQFVAEGIQRGEAGIFCSLEESVDEIRRMAENYGYDIKDLERKGLKIMATSVEYQNPDAIIAEIDSEIRKSNAKRLVVDGLSTLEHTTMPGGDILYLTARRLASLAREKGITTIFPVVATQQTNVLLQALGGLSTLFHNILHLRHVEVDGTMARSMVILKMRSTHYEESILEFAISSVEKTDDGGDRWWKEGPIRIIGSFEGYPGVLAGEVRLPQKIRERERVLRHIQESARQRRRAAFQLREEEISASEQRGREERGEKYKTEETKAKKRSEKGRNISRRKGGKIGQSKGEV